jgi:hypothetical protein
MRTGLLAAAVLALAVAAPGATASGEPGSDCERGAPTVRVECPPVKAEVASIKIKRRTILVGVAVSSRATVKVFGQVSWKVRQPDGSNLGLIQGISAGASRQVDPGSVTSFRVRLEKTVLRRLGRITPEQSLRARMTVHVTDLAGRESDLVFRLRLHGRDRH